MTIIDNMQKSDASIAAGNGVLGQRMLRKEDPALLTGEAVFTNDMKVPGALHLAVLRSPHANARIVSVDVSGALAMDGVHSAYSGADLADAWAAPMPCAWPVTADMKSPPHYPLAAATGGVRRRRRGVRAGHVGGDRAGRTRSHRRRVRHASRGDRSRTTHSPTK